ncbi:hypothetical protein VCRA2117O380_10648 [Vibrio crassostreae]|nr:hypothetical protein VCRA2119O382_10648 [Vibrio crassostreae]CAK1913137.1 hypothetical protein VCRA2117O380_10648 [Vibrio crassostreae]CAK2452238.1 hypothetical protein VCRA2113O360_10648 [Vibrio crassostreae]CAK2707552.1 hypothetical protein VCRA2119O385_10643 [Vibrio crassostreae]CAK3913744.1 hypothetical protein VCRA2130O400_3150002 [Vibrio crassostreae]
MSILLTFQLNNVTKILGLTIVTRNHLKLEILLIAINFGYLFVTLGLCRERIYSLIVT